MSEPVHETRYAAAPFADAELVLDVMPDGFIALDGEWRIVFINPVAEEWAGMDRAEAVGRVFWDLYPAARGGEGERRYREVMATRKRQDFILPSLTHPDHTFDVRAFPTRDGIGIMFRDITARVVAEEQLQRGAVEVRRLIDALPVLVSYVDRNECFQFNNQAYEDWTGRSRESLRGKAVADVLSPKNYAVVKPHIDRALAGERATFEWTGRRERYDDEGHFHSDYIPRLNDEGQPDGFYVVFMDITDARRAQQRLERQAIDLETAVAERTAELTTALDQLKAEADQRRQVEDTLRHAQKMEAVGQLTGGVAHDFNNLLTVIQASTDLLRRGVADPARRERYLEAIAQATERATSLTSQLLAFARRQPLKTEVFDVGAHTQNVRELLVSTLGPRYEIEVEVQWGGPWCVEADPNQYDTALLNIAVNARDAMPDGGKLSIAVAPDPGQEFVAIAVRDEGCGIPPDRLARIFEPFFTTKGVGKGTGLGLSQVYGFARQSKGDIEVESQVGRGTQLTLKLPLTDKPLPAAPVTGLSGRLASRGGRVLIVEDDALVGEMASRVLSELGYTVERAADAAQALELIGAGAAYDCVFSDIVMPGPMSGLDLARRLREIAPGLPVVLATGYSHGLTAESALEFPLLRKPYRLDDVAAALRAVAHA